MENKLDKLFKNKLVNHSMQPSKLAWGKISAATTNGAAINARKFTLVWRVAAAILLLVVIGWFVFDSTTLENNLPVAKEVIKAKKAVPNPIKVDQDQVEIQSPLKAKSEPTKRTLTLGSKKSEELVAVKIEKETDIKEIAINEIEKVSAPTLVEEVGKTETFSGTDASMAKQEKPMVIVYTLASIETKGEKELKVNGLKKVIEFAKEVKGGEATLASVRDWKDNFFGAEVSEHIQVRNNN